MLEQIAKPIENKLWEDSPHWYAATSLAERLHDRADLKASTTDISPKVQKRLNRWKSQSPFDKADFWVERLAQDELSEGDLLELLNETDEELKQRLTSAPQWLETLRQALKQNDPNFSIMPPPETAGSAEKNYYLMLTTLKPLLGYAVAQLQRELKPLFQHRSDLPFEAANLGNLLINSLAGPMLTNYSRTFVLELNVARLQGRLQGESSEARFGDFVRQLNQPEGLLRLLEEYAVMARQFVIQIERWVSVKAEFLKRLARDWSIIRATFWPGGEPGRLVEVSTGAGDVHRGGRSVFKLKFENGTKLVYKPRSLATDVHFQELLAWLNERGNHPPFRTIKLLNRGDYGWVEFVEAGECQNLAEVERFYQRQGGYLALLYALEATDFHLENLIACGEHPVLVDLEALFHPRIKATTDDEMVRLASDKMNYSVLRVGLLPQRLWAGEGEIGIDISGMGGQGGQLSPAPVSKLSGIGTDEMRMVRERIEIPGSQNRPALAGHTINIVDYLDSVLSGFEQIFNLLVENRADLIAGPLARFANDEIRLILRATKIYGALLQESFHPDLLRDALERDRFFDRLWLSVEAQSHLRHVIQAEQADLWAGDIPIFTVRPNSRALTTSRGEVLADFLDETSLSLVEKRLNNLGEADFKQQIWFIRASFTTAIMGSGQYTWRGSRLEPSRSHPTRKRLLKAAQAIGDRLGELALQNDTAASWVGLNHVNEHRWMLASTGPGLYDGSSGVAFFLAYLGQISGEPAYTNLARKAVYDLRQQYQQSGTRLGSSGMFMGVGSLIYLNAHLGQLWREPGRWDEAGEMAQQLSPLIEQDAIYDVIGGSAGLLASLLSLYEVAPSPQLLALARQCGDHLVQQAQPQTVGVGWSSGMDGGHCLAGMSHGGAGIAYSLLRLSAIKETFGYPYRQTALAALEYERSLFSSQHQNWPDLREDAEVQTALGQKPGVTNFMTTWCHGAPGIGMARLASLPYLDDATSRQEIEMAVNTTLQRGWGLNHSLCHGDLGNLELLLNASRVPEYISLTKQRDKLTASILDSLAKYGPLTGMPMAIESPGLMTGLAGIGYGLLRQIAPAQVPSLLTLAGPVL